MTRFLECFLLFWAVFRYVLPETLHLREVMTLGLTLLDLKYSSDQSLRVIDGTVVERSLVFVNRRPLAHRVTLPESSAPTYMFGAKTDYNDSQLEEWTNIVAPRLRATKERSVFPSFSAIFNRKMQKLPLFRAFYLEMKENTGGRLWI